MDVIEAEVGDVKAALDTWTLITDTREVLSSDYIGVVPSSTTPSSAHWGQFAGESILRQAQIALEAGDSAVAKTLAADALKLYGRAGGLYMQLSWYKERLNSLVARHPQEFAPASANWLAALQHASEAIGTITVEDLKLEEAHSALQRLAYWQQALETVSAAIEGVSVDCSVGKRYLDRASDLLSTATIENVQSPRTKDADNLQKAQVAARAAVELCTAQNWLNLLDLWLLEDEGSSILFSYLKARSELDKKGEDADEIVQWIRTAVVALWITELGRVAWRWPRPRTQEAIFDKAVGAQAIGAIEDAQRALEPLWSVSEELLADQAVEELKLAVECDGPGAHELILAQTALSYRNWQKAIKQTRLALRNSHVQTRLIEHYLFELGLLPMHKGLAGWDEYSEAQTHLETGKLASSLIMLKSALDNIPLQRMAAQALLAEVELVNFGTPDPSWMFLTEGQQAIYGGEWAKSLWCARKGWSEQSSLERLTNFYIGELEHHEASLTEESRALLEAARQSKRNKCWKQAAVKAREAWLKSRDKVARTYVDRAKAEIPGWPGAVQAEADLVAKHHDEAYLQAVQALAGRAIENARQSVPPDSSGRAVLLVAEERQRNGRYLQALRSAEVALNASEIPAYFFGVGNDIEGGPMSAAPPENAVATIDRQGLEEQLSQLDTLVEELDQEWVNWSKDFLENRVYVTSATLSEKTETGRALVHFLKTTLPSAFKILQENPKKQQYTLSVRRFLEEGDTKLAELELARVRKDSLEHKLTTVGASAFWVASVDPLLKDSATLLQQVGDASNRQKAVQNLDVVEAAITFFVENKDALKKSENILSQHDDLGRPLLMEVQAALLDRRTSDAKQKLDEALGVSNQWRGKIDPCKVSIDTDNRQLDLAVSQNGVSRIGGSFLARFGFGTPPIDEETSVDDAFFFYVTLADVKAEDYDNYLVSWYLDGKPVNETRQPGQGVVAAPSGNSLVTTFDTFGTKEICVAIKHKHITSRQLKDPLKRYICVKRSRYTLLTTLFTRNSFLELVFVVVVASLIALNSQFYGAGERAFGSSADYLSAFVLGATAKTGQEALKSVPDWLSTLVSKVKSGDGSNSASSAGAGASGDKK